MKKVNTTHKKANRSFLGAPLKLGYNLKSLTNFKPKLKTKPFYKK